MGLNCSVGPRGIFCGTDRRSIHSLTRSAGHTHRGPPWGGATGATPTACATLSPALQHVGDSQ